MWSTGFLKEKIVKPRSHLGFKEIFESTGRGVIKTSRFPSITKEVANDWILNQIVEPGNSINSLGRARKLLYIRRTCENL